MDTLVSRPIGRILKFFVCGLFILLVTKTSASDLETLFMCPDFSSATLCTNVCVPIGHINISLDKNDLTITKKEKDGIKKLSFKDCKVQSSDDWLCNKVRYDIKMQKFYGYDSLARLPETQNNKY